ncbi:hypothetical protein [Bacillus thuringiensis]|uniref:hypothetical protein n=1 Tax=Bacillus thuringiensis TaxID=1428 RepID=UPI0011A95AC2|nr:hypothetical protein [Bacillus thuringiensis]
MTANRNKNRIKEIGKEFFPISSKLHVPIFVSKRNKIIIRDKTGVYINQFLPFPTNLLVGSGKLCTLNCIASYLDYECVLN